VSKRQQRGWIWIAIFAIAFALLALLLLLVPHTHQNSAADFVAILPLLLAGILSPLSLLGLMCFAYTGRVPEAPALVPSFQRPPPFRR
jgi:hypothetical protein